MSGTSRKSAGRGRILWMGAAVLLMDAQGRAVIRGIPVQTTWQSITVYQPGEEPHYTTVRPQSTRLDVLKPGETRKITVKLEAP